MRFLLEKANNVDINFNHRLTQSSKTLQIIQSRINYKQQKYANALLKIDKSESVNAIKSHVSVSRSRSNYLSDDDNYVSAESVNRRNQI